MPVQVEKHRRTRFHATGRVVEAEPFSFRADHFTPPEGAVPCGDDLFMRMTKISGADIYDEWRVTEVPPLH